MENNIFFMFYVIINELIISLYHIYVILFPSLSIDIDGQLTSEVDAIGLK